MLFSDDLNDSTISVTLLLFLSYYSVLTDICFIKCVTTAFPALFVTNLPSRRTCDNLHSRDYSSDLPAYSNNTHKKSSILCTLYDFK